jgi:UDP-N-acetylmuramoylalanine--D-glutamate ligase
VIEDIRFIDDSKATNAHAAATSIRSYRGVVWVAGGLAKGQDFTGLIQDVRTHLRGVVLIGQDRHEIAAALERHSPSTPVVEVVGSDAACMPEVVRAARSLAHPGDVVLLAPACASWDMFTDYQHRGQAFADAVSELANTVSAK